MMAAIILILMGLLLIYSTGYSFRLPMKSKYASFLQSPHQLSSSTDFISSLDKNHDGKISAMEIITAPSEILNHSPLITSFLNTIKSIFHRGLSRRMTGPQLWQRVSSLMSLSDLAIIATLICGYKPILQLLYSLTRGEKSPPYPQSLLGRLETPIKLFVYFPPFLYMIDLLSILFQYLGFDFLVKGDIPRLCCTWGLAIIGGSFLTHLKNYLFFKVRTASLLASPDQRDLVKERTIDELTSLCVWLVVAGVCVQATSIEFGVGLKSLLALGGLGSASFVLALRSTMENLVGGVLLRLQDKFRVGEKISLASSRDSGESTVQAVNYLTTKLRLEDDSYVTIPNSAFITGEVINWSRTPYRLFKTALTVSERDIELLPSIIQQVRRVLLADEGIESQERDLIVAATGFSQGSIVVEIKARLKGQGSHEIAMAKTRVVDEIASVVDMVYKTPAAGRQRGYQDRLEEGGGEKDSATTGTVGR